MPINLNLTDQKMIERLHKAVQHQMTAEEIHRQRVSFVYGNLPKDSPMTRHEVEEALSKLERGAA